MDPRGQQNHATLLQEMHGTVPGADSVLPGDAWFPEEPRGPLVHGYAPEPDQAGTETNNGA